LAWLISAKFERHLPTYRHQEMLLEPLGLWLSRPLLAKLLQGSAHVLRPLATGLLRELLQSQVIQADETPVKYLGQERGKSSTGYLFGYAGDAEHRFLYYDYRVSRSRAGPAEILANYHGVLLTDGFSGYDSLVQESQGRLCAAACWMHARREFDEARATTSHPLVEETLARIRLLYDLEDRARCGLSTCRAARIARETRTIQSGGVAAPVALRAPPGAIRDSAPHGSPSFWRSARAKTTNAPAIRSVATKSAPLPTTVVSCMTTMGSGA
jgi:hypothetical protein